MKAYQAVLKTKGKFSPQIVNRILAYDFFIKEQVEKRDIIQCEITQENIENKLTYTYT